MLAEALDAEGIRVLAGRSVLLASRDTADGPVALTLDDGSELVGDELLVPREGPPTPRGSGSRRSGSPRKARWTSTTSSA